MKELNKSDCCDAPVKIVGDTTKYYVCTKCDEACDTDMKKAIEEAAEASNFMQWFKMKAWDKGINGDKELDELARETYKYFKE